jgi:hypothetical protein
MAVVYASTGTKNNRLAVALGSGPITPAPGESVDAGSGPGQLVIGTSALAGGITGVLATIPLQKPSFSFAGGVATLLGVPLSVAALAGGTAAKAELRDSAGNVIVSGLTVGTSAADVIVTTTTVNPGQTVQVIAVSTISHP